MNTHATPAVRIASRRAGFRRAGMAHPTEPVIHPAGTFSPEQLEELLAEPQLIVDLDPGPTPGGKGSGDGGVSAPPSPDPDAYRGPRIRAAIVGLKRSDESLWTKVGKPQTDAIEKASALKDVSAAERDAEWAAVEAFLAPPADPGDGAGEEAKS